MLQDVLSTFRHAGIRTSIFMENDRREIEAAAEAGADRIELYTEPFAVAYPEVGDQAAEPFVQSAAFAHSLSLDMQNLGAFARQVQPLAEVSIGHALIADALYVGLANAVAQYRACLHNHPAT